MESLAASGTRLASEGFGAAAAAAVSRLLAVLGERVRVGSTSRCYGSRIALPPTQLGEWLDTGGAALLQGGRS